MQAERHGERAAAKKTAGRKKAVKRELIDTVKDKRYVRRGAKGRFNESDDVGRSLAQDRRKKANTRGEEPPGRQGRPMIDLYNDTTGQLLGPITEADLKVLVDALEEESTEDRDYFIDAATIDVIADGRATEHLVALLRTALGTSNGVDIRWERRSEP